MLIGNFYAALSTQLPLIKWYLAGVAIFLVAERLFPAERGQPVRGMAFSLLLSLIYLVSIPFMVALPKAYLLEPITKAFGNPLLSLDFTQRFNSVPLGWSARHFLLPFLPILVFDFFYYWLHRLQHTVPALWKQHKLHHTETVLCAAAASRHHILEEALHVVFVLLPMTLLVRFTLGDASILAPALGYWGIFIHSNIRLPLGILTAVFCGPQYHRIHHSIERQHYNKNYAAFFPLWDVVFGTYYKPAKDEWPATGMEGERVETVWQAMALPFLPQSVDKSRLPSAKAT